jgi:hypothetical protein
METQFKVNDWGPFDYHRDFNLTYPLQVLVDLNTTAGKQDWFLLPNTKLGIQYIWRSLDQFSPRYIYQVDPTSNTAVGVPIDAANGSEWELRTYVHINIGQ